MISWAFLDTFHVGAIDPRTVAAWQAIDPLIDAAKRTIAELRAELEELAAAWEDRLQRFGGDPSRRDWDEFRPLRLAREEDWSDWLAHILAESRTGLFAQKLFGSGDPGDMARPHVRREEVTVDDARRADLLVEWRGGAVTHVEVKVGDENFDKTFDTARGVRARYPVGISWRDFVLVPGDSLAKWLACRETRRSTGDTLSIGELTWIDVAVALRSALLAADEDDAWVAWALSFCGAVEQKLLGHVPAARAKQSDSIGILQSIASQLVVLRRAK